MFYILNFKNHQFISCNNASVVEANIRNFLAAGCSKDSLEIVNGFADEGRLSVDAFRTLCAEQNIVDNSTVDFLTSANQKRSGVEISVSEKPSISLWGRLGISLDVTPGELDILKSRNFREAEDLFVDLVLSNRCSMSGDTYFPVEANEEYLTDMEDELAFDLSSRPLHDGFQKESNVKEQAPGLDSVIADAEKLSGEQVRENNDSMPER